MNYAQPTSRLGNAASYDMEGKDRFEPVLFFDHAEVELNLTATKSAEGGVKVWVLSGKGARSSERTIRLKIYLNGPQGGPYGVGA